MPWALAAMTVSSAVAMIGGEEVPLVFTELPTADAPSGIAHLMSDTVLPASIIAPKSDFVYSNTPETSAVETEEGWIKHQFAKTRPLPTYLVAFGAGPYDVVVSEDIPPNSVRKTPLELRGIAAKGSGERIKYGLAGTEPILTALEEYFGTPYPYEKLDRCAKSAAITVCTRMSWRINGLAI